LDKFLLPVPAPNTIYASPKPEPETPESQYTVYSDSEFDFGNEDYDGRSRAHLPPPPKGMNPEEWKRQVDAVVEEVERRVADKRNKYFQSHPHPLAEVPIRITSQTTVGQHVDQVLQRAAGVADALDKSPGLYLF